MSKQIETTERIIALLQDGHEWSGARIATELKIGSGNLYPVLYALERGGTLTSRWEDNVTPASKAL
jgi:DNA-binding PadR family transcriptional regulator